jgi:hypothetical protein
MASFQVSGNKQCDQISKPKMLILEHKISQSTNNLFIKALEGQKIEKII